jgi:hypothetical protein
MNPSYQWVDIGLRIPNQRLTFPCSKIYPIPHIIDIMGAPIQDTKSFKKECKIYENTTLCISGELKEVGEGIPASNYRFKNDKDKNKNVIRNYQYLFQQFKKITKGKPILVTTIPRSLRILSFHILENGQITCKSKSEEIEATLYSKSMEEMLQKYNITQKNMTQIRESCSDSKYNTYLIDMISFLYQIKVDTPEFHEIFDSEYRNVISILGENIPNGNEKYEKGTSYMFMNKASCNGGYIFFRPTLGSIPIIYKEFFEAINLSDNDTKLKIRSHCCHYGIERWTDFDVNDTDDAFTILMIYHAFHYGTENSDHRYQFIHQQLQHIIQQWSSQLE